MFTGVQSTHAKDVGGSQSKGGVRTQREKKWEDYTKELTERERDLYFKELLGYIQTKKGAGVGFGDKRKKNKREGLTETIQSLNEEESCVPSMIKESKESP